MKGADAGVDRKRVKTAVCLHGVCPWGIGVREVANTLGSDPQPPVGQCL